MGRNRGGGRGGGRNRPSCFDPDSTPGTYSPLPSDPRTYSPLPSDPREFYSSSLSWAPTVGKTGWPPTYSQLDWPPTINGLAEWLGHGGEILVLFETPSGFAVFNYNGVRLYSPKALEDIWSNFVKDYMAQRVIRLKDFETFGNKSAAINFHTGVSNKLGRMIKKWLRPGQKLAVGRLEYGLIIEKELKVHCLFDGAVMELMWGLQNLVKSLVPDERVELTKEDSLLPMSQGMKIILGRYGFDLNSEMVNKEVIEMAYALYECNRCENRHAETLKQSANILKEVSGIDTQNWDALKLVSAVKILSDDELSQLVAEAPKFEGKFFKKKCLGVYNAIVRANRVRFMALRTLKSLVKGERPEIEYSERSELQ